MRVSVSKIIMMHSSHIPDFNRMLVNSILDMIADVPLIIVFSFFAASLLNQKFKGRLLARAIFFLPVILASGIIIKLDDLEFIRQVIFHGSSGEGTLAGNTMMSFQLERYLDLIGIHPAMINYISQAVGRIYQIINSSGVQMLIFLAALQSIPPSLFEASNIEGATSWENFWKITFPMLSPYILTNTIYSIIDNFTSYNNELMRLVNEISFQVAGLFIQYSHGLDIFHYNFNYTCDHNPFDFKEGILL